MAVTATPIFLQAPKHGVVQIVPGDTTGNKTVITAGANGTKVIALYAYSDDTAARDIRVSIVRSATTYPISCVNVPLTSGHTSSIPPVNLFGGSQFPANMLALDQDGQPYLFLESGDTLVVNVLTTVTTAKTITVHADFGNF